MAGLVLIVLAFCSTRWCLWNFVTVGRGTPGPWDPTQKVVATGPYRWVRNPMYIAVLTVILGEAWLFASWPLVVYAVAVAAIVHTFIVIVRGADARRSSSATTICAYRRKVGRWIPRPPRSSGGCGRLASVR